MISMHLLESTAASAILDHLLESTGLAAIAWLITLALRNYPARVRFWVWMSASLKFFVPFALLTSVGARWRGPLPQPAHRVFYTVLEQFNQPVARVNPIASGRALSGHSPQTTSWIAFAIALVWLCGCLVMMVRWTRPWLRARRMVNNAMPALDGPELLALRSAESNAGIRRSIPIAITSRAVEPGIFGVIRPVLLWPAGLSERLNAAQIQAIVAHELEHVRRGDNLWSAFHSLVEVLFWFHPAVHWMRSKMSEERERACDESVLLQSAPQQYAESILKVCAFCLESPLPCVAGVSGSDLKLRVQRILKHRSGVALTFGRRAVLAVFALSVVGLPIGIGAVRGQAASAPNSGAADTGVARDLPKYEVASIKPAASDEGRSMLRMTPDGTSMQGIPVQMLLRTAFRLEADRVIGAPSWVSSNRYDIDAKVAPEDAPKLDKLRVEDRSAMLIPLLVERFNLKYHHETRELPVYTLVVAKGGSKLTPAKEEPAPSSDDPPNVARAPQGAMNMRGRMMMMPGRIESEGSTLDMLAHSLSPQVGHTVIDKTGLTGKYDYTLHWTPDDAVIPMGGGPGGGAVVGDFARDTRPGGPGRESSTVEAGGPSLFTAIEEQLGLKLESTKGPVDVIVIDHIDLPSAN